MATVTTSWKAAPAVTSVAPQCTAPAHHGGDRRRAGSFEAGAYGRCVSCGSALPVERLEFRPCATTCVTCQQPAA
jgi:hypothetical protein